MPGPAERWLALTGYMGAGKSTVGRAVATRLDAPFVDADARIEAVAGMAIPAIFAKRGELWFRRIEERMIRETVQSRPPGVLSLGGGALSSARTRDLLTRTAQVVWLRVDPEVAWGRVSESARPLVTDYDGFLRRLARREPTYHQAADLILDANAPVAAVAERLAEWAGRPVGGEPA